MQLTPIVLIAAILLSDRAGTDASSSWLGAIPPPSVGLLWTLVPYVAIVLGGWVCVSLSWRRAKRQGSARALLVSYRIATTTRGLVLVHHIASVFFLGTLSAVRHWTGNLVLIDELLVLAPPVLAFVGTWAMVYPVERHVREVTLIRMLDEGRSIHPIPSRLGYLTMQLRTQMLPLMLPLTLIMGLTEAVEMVAADLDDAATSETVMQVGGFIATLGVFLSAPLLVRLVLAVEPMRRGPLRTQMLKVCERHRVRVRDVMIWKTGGAMINAAVMGLIAPLRFVLMTDALVDSMTERQLTAVMAHEIGHVRKHHMVWLLIVVFAVLLVATTIVELPLRLIHHRDPMWLVEHPWLEYAAGGVALLLTLVGFGWVSRRFERQADAFAVRHLSMYPEWVDDDDFIGPRESRSGAPIGEEATAITPESVYRMQSALGTIARLNMVPRNRRSWRHGSIEWRQRYLGSLVGGNPHALVIDRVVGRIKIAAILMLIGGGAIFFWPIGEGGSESADPEMIEYILRSAPQGSSG